MAPQPLHRLYLLLLWEGLEDRSWLSEIVEPSFVGVLGATRSGSYVLLSLSPDDRRALMRVNRNTHRVFQGITDDVMHRHRELRRRMAGQ